MLHQIMVRSYLFWAIVLFHRAIVQTSLLLYSGCYWIRSSRLTATCISSCVDNSGTWGHGGMFDALVKLSDRIPEAYERASQFKDLHLGDLHIIQMDGHGSPPRKWVALAVVQSYNARHKVPRNNVSIPDLERCISKAAFSAAQHSASIHMPRIGYRDGSDRAVWYTIERLLGKYASIYGIRIFVTGHLVVMLLRSSMIVCVSVYSLRLCLAFLRLPCKYPPFYHHPCLASSRVLLVLIEKKGLLDV